MEEGAPHKKKYQNVGSKNCPKCKGASKFFDQDKRVSVCNVCGGFGFIKKEENNVSDQKGVNEVHISDLDESGE